jgi:cytidyltransferase-like protein
VGVQVPLPIPHGGKMSKTMTNKEYDIIVLSGGFDPPHVGHVRMFQDAKNKAKRVFIGVNSDEWLMRKKGYVFMPWIERAEVVAGFDGVDEIYRFKDADNTANDLLLRIRKENPYAKIAFGNGGDRTKQNTPETETCKEIDITMIWEVGGSFKAQSSSTLVEKINPSYQKGFVRYNKEN